MQTDPMSRSRRRGLVIVNTGDGKGKTTAALGTALRALGYGWQICMVQFIKGPWKSGEMESLKRFAGQFELHRMGAGFYKIQDDNLPEAVHRRAAADALALLCEKIASEKYDLVIADELNVAFSTGLVKESQLLKVLDVRPAHVHLIITGRGAPAKLIESADLVTEMTAIKHPFEKGLQAQPGIDY